MSNKAINEHHVDIAITKQFLLLKQGARSSAITHGWDWEFKKQLSIAIIELKKVRKG